MVFTYFYPDTYVSAKLLLAGQMHQEHVYTKTSTPHNKSADSHNSSHQHSLCCNQESAVVVLESPGPAFP